MTDRPTLLLTHTLGPELARGLRDRLVDAGLPTDAVLVATTPDETDDLVGEADALVTGGLDPAVLDRADGLRWVQAISAGVDEYPRDELSERGIALTNAAGVHAEPVGELVLAYMLTFERRLHTFSRQQAEARWERQEAGELRGKTLGILGVGAIGTRVAELGSALGMTVCGTKRDLDSMPAVVDDPYTDEQYREVCRASDYLVLACPLTEETRGLVGTNELRLLGADGVLVNVARGAVCDQDALTRALQSHLIRGAALDVFEEEPLPADSPLWGLSNVVVTPHVGGSSPHKLDRWADIVVDNYDRFRAGESLRNRVG